jgi:molybdopterin converting factor small subunit
MHVRVAAFAAARELIGAAASQLDLPPNARVRDAWAALEQSHPALAPHARSMRIARNGRLAEGDETLEDGDEIAVLPPVGGG